MQFQLGQTRRIRAIKWSAAWSGLLCLTLSMPVSAQDEGADSFSPLLEQINTGSRPLLTISFANADQTLEKAKFLFDIAERPEVYERLEQLLTDTLNNLDGFNRQQPFGVMAYLPLAFPPIPEFTAFAPVDSIESATVLIEKAPVVIRAEDEDLGMYEIIGPNRTIPMLLSGGYAFVPLGNDVDATMLDREFPRPDELLNGVSSEYDMAVRLDVEAIPVATRTLLYGLINTGISTQLQQRNEEPDGAYRIRRSEGDRALAALKMLMMDCQKLTFGIQVSEEDEMVNLDLVIDALKGSQMLKEMLGSADRPSYFIPLLDEEAMVSLSLSSMIAEREREAYTEMVEGVRMESGRLLEENGLGLAPDEFSPIGQALTALQSTINEGHMDVFAQFYRDASDKLAIIWAARVQDGDAINTGMMDLLGRLRQTDVFDRAGELQLAMDEHLGVTMHRLIFDNQSRGAMEIFGEDVGITVGIGGTAIWGAVGGSESLSMLKSVMDQLEESTQSGEDLRNISNLRVIVNVNDLVSMMERGSAPGREERAVVQEEREAAGTSAQLESVQTTPDAPGENAGRGRRGRPSDEQMARFRERAQQRNAITRETLAEGDSRIQIESRLTETGAKMRVSLEQAFMKMFARLLATRFGGD